LTWALKTEASATRTGPGHGDISSYVSVAHNLAHGRGFVEDVVGSWWGGARELPTPSNLWWAPLVSIIAALGMLLGQGDYASAQAATAAFSALTPLAVYALGRALFPGRWRTALLGAALSSCFHLFLGQAGVPLSVSPYVVLVPLALALALWAPARPLLMLPAGMAIAASQLSRSDGVLLALPVLLAWWLLAPAHRPRGATLRAAALLALGYLLVMSPWWARNLQVHGAIQPAASGRAAFMRQYDDWHKLPEEVNAQTWLADGWGPIIEQKTAMARANGRTLVTGMVAAGQARAQAWSTPSVLLLMGLAWLGAGLSLTRRRAAALWLHVGALWAFYSLLFTAVGHASFKQSMYGVYPLLLLCAALGMETLACALARLAPSARRARVTTLLLLLMLAPLLTGQARFGLHEGRQKGEAVQRIAAFWQAVERYVLTPLDIGDETLMLRDVHEFHALLGRPAVLIPHADADDVRALARQFGVRYLLLTGADPASRRPGLAQLLASPQAQRVFGPQPILGQPVSVYRLID